ncbi:hypothetical protein JIN84_16310 [Luteolibacter yonseiensis]|uniref:Uncharacterized protein n=1 Tax=Luteolibacter yonseiensis TaxID=1144680 RepID=A0A934R586_9BACT|nr:hypothetical protein [Luteolibacter yonseiensis]MBK1817184.1 hypothetical protein [Luteolibacter yonseiensis]
MKHNPTRLLAGIIALAGLFSCSSPNIPSAARQRNAGESDSIREEARPGLATGWGNEKTSVLGNQSFVRASSKPAGISAIYYNDSKGIKAMTSETYRVKGMQTAAGELVEWGVKGRTGFLDSYNEGYNGWLFASYETNPRRIVEGIPNSTYTIVVRNRSKSALEIVASVDGLDVMDGKTASFSKRGYIVNPGSTLEIEGFRTSGSTVAAFKFSSVSNSYANLRHGDTRNVGVIGLAVFTQKGVNPWTWMPEEVGKRNQARTFAEAPAR